MFLYFFFSAGLRKNHEKMRDVCSSLVELLIVFTGLCNIGPRLCLELSNVPMKRQISAEELAVQWTKAQRKVEAFILSLVPDFSQADDILQNVAMVVVRKQAEYDMDLPFLPWAIQIARFEVLKHRRTMARDRHQFGESVMSQLADAHLREGPELNERRRLVSRCIEQVRGRARRALQFRYVDDLKPSEIAQKLGIGAGAARMILMRARNTVRQCVEKGLAERD